MELRPSQKRKRFADPLPWRWEELQTWRFLQRDDSGASWFQHTEKKKLFSYQIVCWTFIKCKSIPGEIDKRLFVYKRLFLWQRQSILDLNASNDVACVETCSEFETLVRSVRHNKPWVSLDHIIYIIHIMYIETLVRYNEPWIILVFIKRVP